MPILQTEGYFENAEYLFLEEPMLFLLAMKLNLSEKAFSSVKTKTNLHFPVKLDKRSNHSFLLLVWCITFFNNLFSLIYVIESIELNWLC